MRPTASSMCTQSDGTKRVHLGALDRAPVQTCAAHARFLCLFPDVLFTFWCCIAVNSRLLSESGGPCECSEEARADPYCVFIDDDYLMCVEMFRRELVTVELFAMWCACDSQKFFESFCTFSKDDVVCHAFWQSWNLDACFGVYWYEGSVMHIRSGEGLPYEDSPRAKFLITLVRSSGRAAASGLKPLRLPLY